MKLEAIQPGKLFCLSCNALIIEQDTFQIISQLKVGHGMDVSEPFVIIEKPSGFWRDGVSYYFKILHRGKLGILLISGGGMRNLHYYTATNSKQQQGTHK